MEIGVEESVIKPIKNRKKLIIGIIISVCFLLVTYFAIATYFVNHFYFGSVINNISVSGKTVEDVNKLMASGIQTYTLNIKERGGKTEQIKGSKIDLRYATYGEIKDLKAEQNPYKWISAIFSTKNSKMVAGIKYDKALLKQQVDNLSCFDSSKVIEPKNPSFKYTNKGYVILSEVAGNKVNKELLYGHVTNALLKGETTINLESGNYYIKPQYTSSSKKVIDTKNILNKYVLSKITYILGNKKEVIDSSTINKWLKVDKNSEVTFDEKEIVNYMDTLSNKYNTVGSSRSIVSTASHKKVTISGGDYGWSINKKKETQDLVTSIKSGKTITKEPAYSQTALHHGSDDMGNTYVEIDMTAQHLWFYKNGSLVTQGDVVTGNAESGETKTPAGIYKLKLKQKDAILKGEGYASPVTFWMPFNGGIGIHDASWRSVFGGTIYETNGSHGCVNSPYELAKTVYDNIDAGTPIVCYY